MKAFLLCIFSSLVIQASAATYSSDFSSFGPLYGDVAGQDGWTINDVTDQFSFVAELDGSKAIGLGDASAVVLLPSGSIVQLDHGIGIGLGTTTVSFNFAIFDSYNTSTKLNRDQFGISLSSAGNKLFSINFIPETPQPTDPDDNTENSGNGAKWNVYYQVGNDTPVTLSAAVLEQANYELLLELSPNINPILTDFALTITGSSTFSSGATGLALDPSDTADEFSLSWSKVGSNAFGSNVILMDNLSVVPEPSSMLLVSIAGLAILARRKRI